MKLVKRKKAKIICYVRYHKDKDPENHYREQLMLYTPWRKENIDLIKDCQTYQERFALMSRIERSYKFCKFHDFFVLGSNLTNFAIFH